MHEAVSYSYFFVDARLLCKMRAQVVYIDNTVYDSVNCSSSSSLACYSRRMAWRAARAMTLCVLCIVYS
jgi:hypothetical protein